MEQRSLKIQKELRAPSSVEECSGKDAVCAWLGAQKGIMVHMVNSGT